MQEHWTLFLSRKTSLQGNISAPQAQMQPHGALAQQVWDKSYLSPCNSSKLSCSWVDFGSVDIGCYSKVVLSAVPASLVSLIVLVAALSAVVVVAALIYLSSSCLNTEYSSLPNTGWIVVLCPRQKWLWSCSKNCCNVIMRWVARGDIPSLANPVLQARIILYYCCTERPCVCLCFLK